MKIYKKIIIAILSTSLFFSLSFYDEKRLEKANAIVLVDDIVVGAVVAVVLAYTGFSLANANKEIIDDVFDNLSNYSKEVINNIQIAQKYINDGFRTSMAFTYQEITMLINDVVDYFDSKGINEVGLSKGLNSNGEYVETGYSFYDYEIAGTYNTPYGGTYSKLTFPDYQTYKKEYAWTCENITFTTESLTYLPNMGTRVDNDERTITTKLKVVPAYMIHDYIHDLSQSYIDNPTLPVIANYVICSGSCMYYDSYSSGYNVNGKYFKTAGGSSTGNITYALLKNVSLELEMLPTVEMIDGTLSLDPPLKTNEPSMGDIDVYDNNTKVIGKTQLPLILLGSNIPLNGYDDLNGLGPDNVVIGDDQTTPFDDTYPDIVDHVGDNDIDVVTDVGDTDLVTDTNSLADWLAGILSSIFDGIVTLINNIIDWLSDLFGILQSILAYLGTMLSSIISAITGAVTGLLTGLNNLLYSIFGDTIELFKSFFNFILEIIKFLMKLLMYFLQHLYDLLILIWTTLFEKIPLYITGLLGLTTLFAVLPTPLDLIASTVLGISVYMVFLNILVNLKKKGK